MPCNTLFIPSTASGLYPSFIAVCLILKLDSPCTISSFISSVNVNISKISRLRINSECDGVSTLIGCMGCPLRCAYCFNPFTWDGSVEPKKYSIDELYEEVKLDNLYFLAT